MDTSLKRIIVVVIIIAVLAFLASRLFFVVNEGEQAVVIRFGRVLPQDYLEAGLKLKVPFIDQETKYPKKLLSWDGQTDTLLTTSDDKRVLLTTTARWRIADPKIFYARLKGIIDAYNKLDNTINTRVSSVIMSWPMVEIVRTDNEMVALQEKKKQQAQEDAFEDRLDGILVIDEPEEALPSSSSNVSNIVEVARGRSALEQEILEEARKEISPTRLGIELVDVIVRQVQYPDNVAAKTYERMVSERKKSAAEQRSRGEGQKAYWLGRLEKEQQTIEAKAESRAAEIYREAYNKDPEFYRFWRAMDSYEETLADVDKILSTDMAYFDYLYSPQGER